MNQETKYLSALQAAERYEWKDPDLLIYCKGLDKPLRFTRASASPNTTQLSRPRLLSSRRLR
jgi:hypothetical protein